MSKDLEATMPDADCPICGQYIGYDSEINKANNLEVHYWWHKLEQIQQDQIDRKFKELTKKDTN